MTPSVWIALIGLVISTCTTMGALTAFIWKFSSIATRFEIGIERLAEADARLAANLTTTAATLAAADASHKSDIEELRGIIELSRERILVLEERFRAKVGSLTNER